MYISGDRLRFVYSLGLSNIMPLVTKMSPYDESCRMSSAWNFFSTNNE